MDHQQTLLAIIESIDVNIGTAHPKTQESLSEGQHFVIGLLAVCRNNMRGAYFCLREDHAEQARIIGRTLSIDCMRLIYCFKNEGRLEDIRISFAIHSIHEERKLLREFGKHFGIDDTDIPIIERQLDEQEMDEFRAACKAGLDWDVLKREIVIMGNVEQLFRACESPEGYAIFRHASHAAHTSRLTLLSHEEHAEDGTVRLLWGGTSGNVLRVGIQTARFMLWSYMSAAELLGWDMDMIKAFCKHASDKLDQLQSDADIGGPQDFIMSGTPLDEETHSLEVAETVEPDP